jgi:cytochrome c553
MIFNRAIAALAFFLFANAAVADGVLKGDAAAGEALSASCAACHGVDGNSLAPTFPKLAGLGERYLLKQMKDIRDGRRPVALMAGQVDNMTDQQLADIAAFYDSHERGNAPGGYPGLAGQHADYVQQQLEMFRLGYEDESGRTNGGDSKIMRTIAFGLSDLEIKAVASYVSGLQ